MFKKTALSLNKTTETKMDTLLEQLQDMVAHFDLNTGKSMKLLWNYFRPTTLSAERIFDVERSIYELATAISYFSTDKTGE
jgi:hypothetical protein